MSRQQLYRDVLLVGLLGCVVGPQMAFVMIWMSDGWPAAIELAGQAAVPSVFLTLLLAIESLAQRARNSLLRPFLRGIGAGLAVGGTVFVLIVTLWWGAIVASL